MPSLRRRPRMDDVVITTIRKSRVEVARVAASLRRRVATTDDTAQSTRDPDRELEVVDPNHAVLTKNRIEKSPDHRPRRHRLDRPCRA